MIERTLILIKPDGIRRGLTEEIKKRLLRSTGGRLITERKMAQVTPELAEAHYADLAARRGEAVKRRMVAFLASGPVEAIVLEGEGIIAKAREVVGATEPLSAAPGTIRGSLANDSYAQADAEDRAVENLVHASGTAEEASREVELWFSLE